MGKQAAIIEVQGSMADQIRMLTTMDEKTLPSLEGLLLRPLNWM